MLEHRRKVATREVMLAEQPLSGALVSSNVTLIKAGKALAIPTSPDAASTNATQMMHQKAVEWADNGFSSVCHNLTVVRLDQYDHDSIIHATDDIIEIIIDQYASSTRLHQQSQQSGVQQNRHSRYDLLLA